MRYSLMLVLFFFFMCPSVFSHHITVIIPSYNNITWYQKNLDSLKDQYHTDWHAIYINDCSTDGTGDAVFEYIKNNGLQSKIRLVNNHARCGALCNLYHAIHTCNDRDIIVTLDGDDWLYDNKALSYISTMYEDPDIWMSYGMFQEYPGGGICSWRDIPRHIIDENSFREAEWYTSHPRTFYAWLFKRVKKEDLLYQGKFFPKTWDLAFMFPMLEMAGHHAQKAGKILYVYNIDNPLNDYKENLEFMLQLDVYIRSKPRYARLDKNPMEK